MGAGWSAGTDMNGGLVHVPRGLFDRLAALGVDVNQVLRQ